MGRRIRRWREGKERQISFSFNPQSVYRVKMIIDEVDHQDGYHLYNLVDKVFDRIYSYPFNLNRIRNIRMKRCRGTLDKFCVTFTTLIHDSDLKYYQMDNVIQMVKIK